MTISYIKFYAPNDTMGDSTDAECDAFRAFAQAELEHEYPDAEIIVSDESCTTTLIVGEDDWTGHEGVSEFVQGLWDKFHNGPVGDLI